MSMIPSFDERDVLPQAMQTGALGDVGSAGATGAALQQLGSAGLDLYQKLREQDEYAFMAGGADLKNKWTDDYQNRKEAAAQSGNVSNFVGALQADRQADLTNYLKSAPTARAAVRVQKYLSETMDSEVAQAGLDAHSIEKTDLLNKLDTTMDGATTRVYRDPSQAENAVGDITGIIRGGVAAGLYSNDDANALIADKTSNIYGAVIQHGIETDPQGTYDLVRSGHFDPFLKQPQIAQIEAQLKPAVMTDQSRSVADRIMAGAPTASGDLESAVVDAESGGNPAALSGKGAVGIMQLMPGTARDVATKLGVPYDADKLQSDPEYNKALGSEFLREMLARYGGDQTLALAAYNAGPSAVDGWVKQIGDPTKGQISDTDFVSKIPYPETRNYVTKVNAQVAPVAGTPPTSTDPRDHVQGWLDQGQTIARAMYPDDPTFADQVDARIKSRVATIEYGQEQAQRATRDSLINAALGTVNPGTSGQGAPQKPTDLDQLLGTPDMKAAWASAPPEVRQSAMDIIEHNARGDDPPATPDALKAYYKLKGQAATDPDGFVKQDLTNVISILPHTMTKELMDLQASMQTTEARDASRAQNLNHAMDLVKPMAAAVGVNVSPKAGSPDEATLWQLAGRVSQAVSDFQTQNRRLPNDDEIRELGRSLLIGGFQRGTAGWLSGDRPTLAFQQSPENFYPNVPADARTGLSAALSKKFGRAPTDQEIQGYYMAARAKGLIQ